MKSRGVLSFEFGLYRLANGLSRLLPFRLLQAMGRTVGALFFLLSSRRRIVLGNLRRVFPDWNAFQRGRTALRCGAHFGRIAFDYLKWSRTPEEVLRRNIRLEGLEHLKEALEKGRGAFILSAHFGHWEMAALRLSLEGFPQAMVHRPLDNPRLEEELSRRRTRFGNTLIPKTGAMKEMLRAVKRNGIVDILIDQKADPEGSVRVPFLGLPTPTIASLARLVQSTGAAVVPLFSYPDGMGYRVVLFPDIPCDPGATPETLTGLYNSALSQAIMETPHLWLWFHNRWRI